MHNLDQQKKTVGQYLKILRKINKLTLKEVQNLSFESGKKISISLLSKIESGMILPSIPVLMVLSKIYDVRLKLFLEKLESENTIPYDSDEAHSDTPKFNEFPALDPKKIKKGLLLLKPNKKSLLLGNNKNLFSILLHTEIFLRKTGKLDLAKEAAELLVLAAKRNSKNLARSFFELAFIYKLQNNLPLALTAISESERIGQKIKRLWFTPHIFHLKGNILRHSKKPGEAIIAFNNALERYGERNFKDETCKVLNCLGDSYILLGKHKKARFYLEKAFRMAKRHHFMRTIALALHNRGCSFYSENRLENAVKDFAESNALAITYNCQDIVLGNYFYLMNSYEKLNDQQSKDVCLKGFKYYYSKSSNIPVIDNKVKKYIEDNIEIA